MSNHADFTKIAGKLVGGMHDNSSTCLAREIAQALSAAYRAALEEAVKAVCWRCDGGVTIGRHDKEWMHSYRNPLAGKDYCPASAIHNLLAAEPQQPGATRAPAKKD